MRWLRHGLAGLSVLTALCCLWLAAASNRSAAPQVLPIGPPAAAETVTPASDTLADGRLNLNTADKEQLMTLPGIGPHLAEAILQARAVSPFHFVEDLRAVPGIGEKRLAVLKPLVRVGE